MCTSHFKQVQVCKVDRMKVEMGIDRWGLKLSQVFLKAAIPNHIPLIPDCPWNLSYTLLYM